MAATLSSLRTEAFPQRVEGLNIRRRLLPSILARLAPKRFVRFPQQFWGGVDQLFKGERAAATVEVIRRARRARSVQ
jgi:hypothetical protein